MNLWERRTAIVSTSYFIKKGELDDTFAIARELLGDDRETVQKAVGSWIRHAGKTQEDRLTEFLDEYATQMSPTTLRFALQQLPPTPRAHYRQLDRR